MRRWQLPVGNQQVKGFMPHVLEQAGAARIEMAGMLVTFEGALDQFGGERVVEDGDAHGASVRDDSR